MMRDSMYFLLPLLSSAIVFGWLIFVTIAP
jgi:hypothetical protein